MLFGCGEQHLRDRVQVGLVEGMLLVLACRLGIDETRTTLCGVVRIECSVHEHLDTRN